MDVRSARRARILRCTECGRSFAESKRRTRVGYEGGKVVYALCSKKCTDKYSIALLEALAASVEKEGMKDPERFFELQRRISYMRSGQSRISKKERKRAR